MAMYTSRYAWEKMERGTFENIVEQKSQIAGTCKKPSISSIAVACPRFNPCALTGTEPWQSTRPQREQSNTHKGPRGFCKGRSAERPVSDIKICTAPQRERSNTPKLTRRLREHILDFRENVARTRKNGH